MKTTDIKTQNTKLANDQLSEYGLKTKQPVQPEAPKFKTKVVSGGTQGDLLARHVPKVMKKMESRSQSRELRSDIRAKLGVRDAELMRQIESNRCEVKWQTEHGSAKTKIDSADWKEINQTIAKFIGNVMEANSLEWQSGHEWSLERGDLVEHISQFILKNAVHNGKFGKRFIEVK